MKILVTGATGYIGGAAAKALVKRGHEVFGLARSEASAGRLRLAGITPVAGDFTDNASLIRAASGVDTIVSTASIGSLAGSAETFAQDRDAIRAMLGAVEGSGKTLIFTSGSAVLGIVNGGEATRDVFDEDVRLPLPPAVFAPASANVPPLLVEMLGAAMGARVETEKEVANASGIRGIVMRPGLVYGNGGSYDLPALIRMARAQGVAPHLGAGGTLQGYVHVDDLAELYCLAVEGAPAGAVLHGVAGEVSQRELAAAVSRMIGAGDRTASLQLEEMYAAGGPVGVSLSLNKRMSSDKTRRLLGWSPTRTDILHDIEFGSYAA
ncbi:NAD-dependent epimerase/dehydratase family protein [Cupriavidus sp. CV2]|uniref:NAD-dependent epimerase/dehydratase family protein n=1 Tax=Cupriavidus ulmosensis TaxID=3065913 RepID=UPI00296AD591|nr:NAD-dependent epimerase/dehydratase family protein [Cupriavidus sp. CV2]MDW3688352.1 NAD-dependent epimerase/dehydratase family protein [Cupriavidus sp. CV2]